VPEVVGLFAAPPTQFALKLQAGEFPCHDEIVPAEAVPAAVKPTRERAAMKPERNEFAVEGEYMVRNSFRSTGGGETVTTRTDYDLETHESTILVSLRFLIIH
jgi:hypothetical protein